MSETLRGLVLGPGLLELAQDFIYLDYSFDHLLSFIPRATHLTLYLDYVTLGFFKEAGRYRDRDGEPHPLRHLVIGSEDVNRYDELLYGAHGAGSTRNVSDGGYVYDAGMKGGLGNLRIVSEAGRLAYGDNGGLWESPLLEQLLEKLDDEHGGFEEALEDPEVKEGPWDEQYWW